MSSSLHQLIIPSHPPSLDKITDDAIVALTKCAGLRSLNIYSCKQVRKELKWKVRGSWDAACEEDFVTKQNVPSQLSMSMPAGAPILEKFSFAWGWNDDRIIAILWTFTQRLAMSGGEKIFRSGKELSRDLNKLFRSRTLESENSLQNASVCAIWTCSGAIVTLTIHYLQNYFEFHGGKEWKQSGSNEDPDNWNQDACGRISTDIGNFHSGARA